MTLNLHSIRRHPTNRDVWAVIAAFFLLAALLALCGCSGGSGPTPKAAVLAMVSTLETAERTATVACSGPAAARPLCDDATRGRLQADDNRADQAVTAARRAVDADPQAATSATRAAISDASAALAAFQASVTPLKAKGRTP